MTVKYHGTPITPTDVFRTLEGRSFCISHAAPDQVRLAHEIGKSVMLDNGAFSAWKRGHKTDWTAYYAWAEPWLDYPSTWAVIPDDIEGDASVQDALLGKWPFGEKGAPVWHMHEPTDRLLFLIDHWPRVCIGSSGQYAQILSPSWERRMDAAWRSIGDRATNVHMLRGMQLLRHRWPFASVDSTDIARNHNRPQNTAFIMAARWEGLNCPTVFHDPGEQLEMVA